MHDVVPAHEIPLSPVMPAGTVCGDQVLPPLTVLSIEGVAPPVEVPSTVQCVVSKQETPATLWIVLGNVWSVHVVPPLVVARMLGAPAVLSKLLTAMHSDTLGQD